MILFFYGEDDYRLKKKIKALKERFISASLGDTNLSVLEGQKATTDEIMRQVLAIPFLSRKRLVIIENLLSKAKKSAKAGSSSGGDIQASIAEKLSYVPEETVLVFTEEGIPDRRTALFKKLKLKAQTQEFTLLEDDQLRRWIKKEIESRNAAIETAALPKLIEYVGSDLWRMSNELDKLAAYKKCEMRNEKCGIIQTEDIELLVQPQIQTNVFKMIEAVANHDINQAMKELYKLINSGENVLYILSMIVYEYRNLIMCKDLIDRNYNRWAIIKKTRLHPYVVGKSIAMAGKYSLRELISNYQTLLDFDVRIKTGKIEPGAAIEMLIYKLTSPKSEIPNPKL